MKITVAQFLIRYLKEQGVQHIFGMSGHSVFEFTDAIYQEPGVDFIPAQIEVAGGYMANGYARGTRDLAVCLVSGGPGATNAVSPIALASKESFPVLALTSDVPRAWAAKGSSNYHGIPQREIFEPITKLSITLDRAEDALEVAQDAVRTAMSGRFGPVFLAVPTDLHLAEIEVPEPPWNGGRPAPQQPDPTVIARAAELLRQASTPIIIAGGGVYWARAEGELTELAEVLGAPFGTTPSYKGMVSEHHPFSLGGIGLGEGPFVNKVCQEADVILAVGTTFSEALTRRFGDRVIPKSAKIIHVDLDPSEIGKSYSVEIGIVGDAKLALRGLIAQLRTQGRASSPDRVARIRGEKEAWHAEMARRGEAADGPINRWQLYGALREALDEDAIVVGEGGTGELLGSFVATAPIFHGGDYQPIGHGQGTSMGLKVAFPDRQVACVSGDGSFMTELQELATQMRAGLPILNIIVHNDAYGGMKRDQLRDYGGRVIGVDLHVPDLTMLARSFGLHGARVERSADLVSTFRDALATGRPSLVDVVCPIA